ncbi:MAG: chemotaxis protein CheA [Phycisphaerales bacterium]|jgi:two-component system chemotaxis sensor kinase CheA
MGGFDAEIVRDFLTESGELINQLESDLVILERAPKDPAMLNQVFRALHTIKGSASFLAITPLVRVAHAAETALNAARNGQADIDRGAMDLLLEATDLIKSQLAQIEAGGTLPEAREHLVSSLVALGEGGGATHGGHEAAAPGSVPAATPSTPNTPAETTVNAALVTETPKAAPAIAAGAEAPRVVTPTATAGGVTSTPLTLEGGKADLIEFLIADLDESTSKVAAVIQQMCDPAASTPAKSLCDQLGDLGEQLVRTVQFFDFAPMVSLAIAVHQAGLQLPELGSESLQQVFPRLRLVCEQLAEMARGIRAGELRSLPPGTLVENITTLLHGGDLAPTRALPADAGPADAGRADGAWCGTLPGKSAAATTPDAEITAKLSEAPEAVVTAAATGATSETASGESAAAAPKGEPAAAAKSASAENTIRVDVSRLEALMNLVGELVLQKNRVSALTRRAQLMDNTDADFSEAITLTAGALDRVTGEIQTAVMRTRLQPLDKLFGRYPRLIRDLAGKTGKKMTLVIEGGDTEVDKSVIEELGDPLVHLLRNSADHGLEMPEEGSHVRVQVADDGRGLWRDKIAKKAIERGLTTPEKLAQASDRDVFNFIFEAGFSTAEKVSDLSGRGVGMDVVRTNIQKVKGEIELTSEPGRGTTVTIIIPLTVAILPAMMVGVGKEIYAIPLTNILEIVRPQADQMNTIGEHAVMRLRNTVLPLVSASEVMELRPQQEKVEEPFAVVLSMNDRRIGLMVTKLIGQQEVVIKPLDESHPASKRAVSGATVRDDGGVSLIIDVAELMRRAETLHHASAA